MSELPRNQRKRLRFGPLLCVLLPSLVTLVLVVLPVFTMFFTEFDWQWVTFLAGILFASVLALVSASLKGGWRTARCAAEAAHFRQRLSAEIEQHGGTLEQLERGLALHQQDRTRLAKEAKAHRLTARDKFASESLLGMLELHLDEIAFYVDRHQRYRFHTRRFSAWTGVPSERINGFAFAEALPPRDAGALRAPEALAKVRAIQRGCKVIGIRTIAEIVETDDCLKRLRVVEVDYVQGFGIAKPYQFSYSMRFRRRCRLAMKLNARRQPYVLTEMEPRSQCLP